MTTEDLTIYELFADGGWVMWGLLVLSVVGLAAAVERFVVLGRARRGAEVILSRLQRALFSDRSLDEARKACRRAEGPIARLALAGLSRFEGPSQQLEATLERHASTELRSLSRRLKVLATVAATAPLLGFLGTVTGMIAAFEALIEFSVTAPSMVAAGISEALITTAAGLIVAVPAQLLYSALSGRLDKITGHLEDVAHLLLEAREGRGSAETGIASQVQVIKSR